jgi:hypothetical protein
MLPLLTYLALTIPGSEGKPVTIKAPRDVPTGGLQKGGTGQEIIQNSITLLLVSITILSLFFLIFGGIKWITSQGDKSKVESARKTIIYAVVGLALSFMSFFIINVVGGFFGVKLLGS